MEEQEREQMEEQESAVEETKENGAGVRSNGRTETVFLRDEMHKLCVVLDELNWYFEEQGSDLALEDQFQFLPLMVALAAKRAELLVDLVPVEPRIYHIPSPEFLVADPEGIGLEKVFLGHLDKFAPETLKLLSEVLKKRQAAAGEEPENGEEHGGTI